jgi:exodeoxyribonuclease V alpha subunit
MPSLYSPAPGASGKSSETASLFPDSVASPPSSNSNASAADPEEVLLRGKVSKVIYEGPEGDFYIFTMMPQGAGREVKVKGYGVGLAKDREIECIGRWELDKYKERLLSAGTIMEIIPNNLEGMRKLLHSGFVPRIGKATADALLRVFGDRLFDIAENSPDVLYAIPGVGEQRVNSLVRTIREKRALPRIMSYLASVGLGPGLSHRVFREMGPQAVTLIEKNPYSLTRVPLIGFTTADKVARRRGIPFDSEMRIVAGMEAVLLAESERGSTAVALPRLIEQMGKLLAVDGQTVPPSRLASVVNGEIGEGKRMLQREILGGVKAVSLSEFVRSEQSVATNVNRVLRKDIPIVSIDMGSRRFAHLDADQQKAAKTSLESAFSVITGRPGCGKTTVTKSIVDALVEDRQSVLLCAPTGRASKRITEATGYAASTMHRALGSRGAGVFVHNENNPLPHDVVLIDETSMVDTWMMDKMMRAIRPGTRLIMVGDADQLPSIGAGNVLSDVISSGVVPVSVLRQIHRQAQGSSIILNAHQIINGNAPKDMGRDDFQMIKCTESEKQVQMVVGQYRSLVADGFKPEDIQILTPMRKKTDLGANNLNRVMKEILNPSDGKPSVSRGKGETAITFSVGDRIMQVANNRELGIYNGDIGYIMGIDKKAQIVTADFSGEIVDMEFSDLEDVDLAYATTIHKSQGSEFKAVILPVARSHSYMLDRNLIYTAVTRGKDKVVMGGDLYMLPSIVQKAGSSVRMTGLQDELCNEAERLANEVKFGRGALFKSMPSAARVAF